RSTDGALASNVVRLRARTEPVRRGLITPLVESLLVHRRGARSAPRHFLPLPLFSALPLPPRHSPAPDANQPAGGPEGAGGQGGVAQTVTTGSGTSTAASGLPAMSEEGDAIGVSLAGIAVYQGVKVDLMKDGAPAMEDIPIVADRPALVRLFVAT